MGFIDYRKKSNNFIFAFLTAWIALFSSSQSLASFANGSIKNLTILAEPNMVAPLTKIARLYSQKNSVVVSVSFGSAHDLIGEIDSGEPADIFISGHRNWINSLRQKGLIDIYSITHIANDNLVLATSSENLNIAASLLEKKMTLSKALEIIDHGHSVLILDNENTSLGQYSHNLLNNSNFSNLKLVEKLSEDKNSVLNLLTTNTDNYAILLSSQVNDRRGFKLLSNPKDMTIFYQALVIAGDNMEAAREFAKFLHSVPAKIIFRENGFSVD